MIAQDEEWFEAVVRAPTGSDSRIPITGCGDGFSSPVQLQKFCQQISILARGPPMCSHKEEGARDVGTCDDGPLCFSW